MNAFRPVCPFARLPVERGVVALLDGVQVALFRGADDRLHAVSNHDPFSGAMVISRGIVGSRGDRPTVASPVYKQVFDLETGECLSEPGTRLPVYAVRVEDGVVQVAVGARALSA